MYIIFIINLIIEILSKSLQKIFAIYLDAIITSIDQGKKGNKKKMNF